ncbi:hypothetical protein P43SY_004120 [Pythium insidiosum]|uniref:Transmembrane protein n=1 Tax=Pythium insidiosum TaxID=114742 RepID=A0AAD5Q751_PYTIN|nr:hypothetical protein P43SY_004120 [Pythium insidiosum]
MPPCSWRDGAQRLRAAERYLRDLVTDHHSLGRYSIEKLHLFELYQQRTSPLRVLLVILLTPVPAFVAMVALDIVPMRDPCDGPARNVVAFVRSTIGHGLMTFSVLLPLKQALGPHGRTYTVGSIALIAVCVCVTVEIVCITLAFMWRFPVPFREFIGLPVWTLSVAAYHYAFARAMVTRNWRRLQVYVPLVGVQISLFYAFLAMSIGFVRLSTVYQIAMIAAFPLVKVALKRLVWKHARQLEDISTDITICMVEVSGSLYQTVCVDSVGAQWISVLLMLTDVVQAAVELRAYVRVDYLSDGKRSLVTARKIVEASVSQGLDERPSTANTTARTYRIESNEDSRDSLSTTRPVLARLSSLKRLAGASSGNSVDSRATARGSPRLLLAGRINRRSPQLAAPSVYLPRRAVHLRTKRRLLDLNSAPREGSIGRDSLPRRSSIEMDGAFDDLEKMGTNVPESPGRRRVSDVPPLPSLRDVNSTGGTGGTDEPWKSRRRRGAMIDGVYIARRDQARVLEQTLQLMFACEVLLFVEYMEVVVPVMYAICLGGEWLLPNAQYNLIVRFMSQNQVGGNVAMSFVYASLELLSLLAMYWIMKSRYGISAFYQLAFLLEKYWMTLQGKLVGAFLIVSLAATEHQGTDFTFRFDRCSSRAPTA